VHYARAFDWRGIELRMEAKKNKVETALGFTNDAEGFEKLITWISKQKRKHEKREVVVGLEPTGHYWFNLSEYLKKEKIKLVLVNPFHVKRSKELDDNLQSKTDLKDPKTIAKLVIEGRYLEPYVPEGIYAELRTLCNFRNKLQKEIISVKNHLNRWLNIYFPEYKKVFSDITAKSSIAVLKKTPLPCDMKESGAEGINQIWRELKLRAVGKKKAESLYEAAEQTVGVTEGLKSARLTLTMLLTEYEIKMSNLEIIEEQIIALCRKVPAVKRIEKIKGVGIMTIASFLAEVGDVNRFESSKQIQKLAGLALRECSSGKHKGKTTISKRGRPRLRQLLFQASMPLVAKNDEFAQLHKYYTTRESNPLKKKQSIIAISCKLIRILFTMFKKEIEYDPQKLVSDIKRTNLQVA